VVVLVLVLLLVIVIVIGNLCWESITSTSTSMSMSTQSDALPTPARIGYRRKALAKFSLLALGISLLVCFARLLLGTRA